MSNPVSPRPTVHAANVLLPYVVKRGHIELMTMLKPALASLVLYVEARSSSTWLQREPAARVAELQWVELVLSAGYVEACFP